MPAQGRHLPLTEADRRRRAAQTGGQPVLDFGPGHTPYATYLGADQLLELGRTRTKAGGEPTFMIMGQVMELLFKLLHTEARRVRDELDADDVEAALWVLRRMRRSQDLLARTWDAVGALSPNEYAEFRDELGEGSGFQSFAYRRLEFILGNKHPELVRPHRGNPRLHQELLQTLRAPSLYDAALRLLWRRGLPVPRECRDREWDEPYVASVEVERAWAAVYADVAKHSDLYRLAESFVDVAYDFSRWRAVHLLTVERIIGGKVGTGGTSGVHWLRRAAEHRFFPELWAVRAGI